MIEPYKISEISKKYADKNMKFRAFLKDRADPDELDQQFRNLHNEIFIRDEYDCCKCANCCKLYDIRMLITNSPRCGECGYDGELDIWTFDPNKPFPQPQKQKGKRGGTWIPPDSL